MRWIVPMSLASLVGTMLATPAVGQTDADAAFLRMAAHESGGEFGPTMTDSQLRPASMEMGGPPMGVGSPPNMNAPTPAPGHGFYGASNLNYSTDDSMPTIGPRLDMTYGILREFEVGGALSEHQHVAVAGPTILPFQTPCMVFGVRGMGGYVSNLSYTDSEGVYTIDAFFGTRYKKLYSKVGFLMDDFQRHRKMGITASAMTEVLALGTWSADFAYGFRNREDEIFPEERWPATLRSRRVEQADHDVQIRIGKFFTENCQAGFTYNYYDFDFTPDDSGYGAFGNFYCGRFRFGWDVTGGKEGLRGYLKLVYSFGAHPCDTPRDCRVSNVDAIAWVSRATDRDVSIRLRESFTGPPPPGP